jgi:hypothetical protein
MKDVNIVDIITGITSLFAIGISIFTFRRQTKMEYEQHLHKEKLVAYQELLKEMTEMIKLNDTTFLIFERFEKSKDPNLGQTLRQNADIIDATYYNFYYSLAYKALIVPNSIFQKIEKWLELLSENNNTYKGTPNAIIENLSKDVTKLTDEIVNAMRDDLNVEEINLSIRKKFNPPKK